MGQVCREANPINTWLKPGDYERCGISKLFQRFTFRLANEKPLKRLHDVRNCRITRLKPGENETTLHGKPIA